MKTVVLSLAVVLAVSVSAEADTRKVFTVSVEPPDASIRVISGRDLNEHLYRSPASITVSVPDDRELAKKTVLEITRERHKRVIIPLRNIRDGEVLKIRLEKDSSKTLRFRMIAPGRSDDVRIKDSNVDLSLVLSQKQMQMSLTNLTPQPVHIVWQRASYTDPSKGRGRLMHSGIRYEDRNRSFPVQTVMPYTTLHQAVIPVDKVMANLQGDIHETEPLFPGEGLDRLNGKELRVLIPVQVGNEIVQYDFRVKVVYD